MPAAWAADALLVVFRWLHGLAAVAFLGWALVLFLSPSSSAGSRFKEVTELTLLVFLATGAVLSFDRLSNGAGAVYAVVLLLKVLCSIAAYQFAFRWRRAGLAAFDGNGRLVLILGGAAVLLAAVLTEIFEYGLRGAQL
ncbi:MAG: hypothetical protein JO023_15720 [Chloroflexi bacterium]|nr:hypothetical protein [Chloroflexota bacterium]